MWHGLLFILNVLMEIFQGWSKASCSVFAIYPVTLFFLHFHTLTDTHTHLAPLAGQAVCAVSLIASIKVRAWGQRVMPGMPVHLNESQKHTREYTPAIQTHTWKNTVTLACTTAQLQSYTHSMCVCVCLQENSIAYETFLYCSTVFLRQ